MSKYEIHAKVIHSVGDGITVIVGLEKDKLDKLLSKAIEQTVADSDSHKALADIQTELKDNGTVSSKGRETLDQAVAALPHADKAVGILSKVVNALDKLVGMVS